MADVNVTRKDFSCVLIYSKGGTRTELVLNTGDIASIPQAEADVLATQNPTGWDEGA